ncbi:hypothetical protein HKD37_12G033036 [Glycine soja]
MTWEKGVPKGRIGATLHTCCGTQIRSKPHHHLFLLCSSQITVRNQKHQRQQQTLILFPFHFSGQFPRGFSCPYPLDPN